MTATALINKALEGIQVEVLPINLDETYLLIHECKAFEDVTLNQITAYLEEVCERRIDKYYPDPCGLRFEVSRFNYLIDDWEYDEDVIAYSKPKKMIDVLKSYGVAA